MQKRRGTLGVKPPWHGARHSANPAEASLCPAVVCDPRHGDGLGGGRGDRPTSGNAHVASGMSPRRPHCLQGTLLGVTGSSGLLSLSGEGAEAPENVMESPELERESRNSAPRGREGVLLVGCCPTWQYAQRCIAAAGPWLRYSQKGTRGWSIPEGEGMKFLLMVRQKRSAPLGMALVGEDDPGYLIQRTMSSPATQRLESTRTQGFS